TKPARPGRHLSMPALTVRLRGDVLGRSKRPDVALPLRRTARATWSRYRSSATSGSAHPARPRMPFPGRAPHRDRAWDRAPDGSPRRILGDVLRAVSENDAGRGRAVASTPH